MLYRLAQRAAAVVTDDYPTFSPVRSQCERAAKLDMPYYAVDASCIAPMACFEEARIRRLHHPAEDPKLLARLASRARRKGPPSVPRQNPGASTRPYAREHLGLVAACHIDHTVPPSRRLSAADGSRPSAASRFLETRSSPLRRRKEPARRARHLRPQPLSALRLHLVPRSGLAVREHAACTN